MNRSDHRAPLPLHRLREIVFQAESAARLQSASIIVAPDTLLSLCRIALEARDAMHYESGLYHSGLTRRLREAGLLEVPDIPECALIYDNVNVLLSSHQNPEPVFLTFKEIDHDERGSLAYAVVSDVRQGFYRVCFALLGELELGQDATSLGNSDGCLDLVQHLASLGFNVVLAYNQNIGTAPPNNVALAPHFDDLSRPVMKVDFKRLSEAISPQSASANDMAWIECRSLKPAMPDDGFAMKAKVNGKYQYLVMDEGKSPWELDSRRALRFPYEYWIQALAAWYPQVFPAAESVDVW